MLVDLLFDGGQLVGIVSELEDPLVGLVDGLILKPIDDDFGSVDHL